MKNIIKSVKETIKDHKPEVLAAGIVLGSAVVLLAINAKLKTVTHIQDDAIRHLRSGKALLMEYNGDSIAMYIPDLYNQE